MNKYLPLLTVLLTALPPAEAGEQYSGVYPHLTMHNDENECGTGAVVPWADRLWIVTYAPHKPMGSNDRLNEITPDLKQIIRPESIGGTPANRMIHRESNQLFIGPHAINGEGKVRTIPYGQMPGRHTGNARHLSDPAGKIHFATMEEGLYSVDVNTLAVGSVWLHDDVKANAASDPYLFSGYDHRLLVLTHSTDSAVTFTLEVDQKGNDQWTELPISPSMPRVPPSIISRKRKTVFGSGLPRIRMLPPSPLISNTGTVTRAPGRTILCSMALRNLTRPSQPKVSCGASPMIHSDRARRRQLLRAESGPSQPTTSPSKTTARTMGCCFSPAWMPRPRASTSSAVPTARPRSGWA